MNTLSKSQQGNNKKKTGNKWEEYYFSTQGGTRNKDWFDHKGDGTDENGDDIEVKGQVPYARNSLLERSCIEGLPEDVKFIFSVPIYDAKTNRVSHNQLNKCVQVKTLIWGRTPVSGDTIELYAATSRKFFIYQTNDGRIMAAFYEFELISRETNPEMATFLRSHSNSSKIIGDKSPYYKGK
jgi:hypothetical protein